MRVETRRLTLGRTFLLWLLGVLVVTMVVVSALVLWHEEQILEDELRARADLLAHMLAFAAADGGSAEYLAIISMTDLRAGEVRSENGQLLWQFGPSAAEIEALDTGFLRVRQRVVVSPGPLGEGDSVEVLLIVSRARMRSHLAMAAMRLLAGLGIALTLALVAGLALIGRVVRPLQDLASWVRNFDPEQPIDLPDDSGTTAEVGDLAVAFEDMAQRLAAQRRSLVASEQRFRELFTASPSPLLRLDQDLCLRGANPAAEPYLGGDASRSVGSSLAGFLARPTLAEVLTALRSTDSDPEVVLEADWRIGEDELAEVELRLVAAGEDETKGYLLAIHDVTDRVRRMGERWRRTFDAMVDGVALVDRQGRIALANQALEAHAEAVSENLEQRLQGKSPLSWRAENVGRLLDCSLNCPEGMQHAVLVVRDVTEAVDAEGRLRNAEKMQAVGTLASGVAHDFNNLLAAILLHIRLVERQPESMADAAAAIGDLAEQGTEVVRELLLFARRESSPPSTVDLVDLVQQQEGVLQHVVAEAAELHLELDDEPVPVVADVVGLRRLLLNLVLNARDAVTESGGTITVRVEHTAGRAVLEVADDGPGIPPEVRQHLFEPFFTLRRQGRGAGLGLAVVYGIVTAHDGEVDVRSTAGHGARFIVRFPLGDVSKIETLEGRGASESRAGVLLFEPDGRAAAHIIEGLADESLEVRHAPTIAVAGELLDRWAPSVVVVSGDPAEEGLAAWLRAYHVPVVVISESESTGTDSWGSGVVRIQSESSPAAVLEALRNLGVIAAS